MNKEIKIDGITYIQKGITELSDSYVIVRGDRSGIFAGEIIKEEGREATLLNARCIFYWSGAATILQLASDGVNNPDDCQFTVEAQEIRLKDVVQVVPCTQKAQKNIKAVPVWKV